MVAMNVTEASTAHAIIVSEGTRNATIGLLEIWLELKGFSSMEEAKRQYRLHSLDLEYPLKEAANNSDYDGEDSESPEVELDKIFESLSKFRQLMSHINKFLPNDWYNDYFSNFEVKLEHNMSVAAHMLGIQNCTMDTTNEVPAHRHNHPLLEFAIVEEMTRLLKVLEKKYRVMHRRVTEAANA
ncbi:uncharacterized protein [Drosophila virilis]|uniref:Uncharacterized protein, isoform B n=1 Tax=Drosophila virilis TaxID=7244 RepID=B4M3B9_DROVI|nr:uncharacterized protein LOC6632001 [Drosophila virilis]XP_015026497.1 uncharacterized protein LOC6632001 [Drosophila virilis]EDW65294.2 uncharacterized protein Dvir_GJ18987, isoform C [Drosophila virilis]KRF82168.1 uncharacterized protein Dvir_GJ18987, isoform B [Drosophila virilis]